MGSCKTRQFVPLSEKEVGKNGLVALTSDKVLSACDVLDKTNGNLIDMKLIEVIDDTSTSNSKIFRYKANFERNEIVREIRIWLGTDGKFQGIICETWQNKYEPYRKK